jgi:hypothetical protein
MPTPSLHGIAAGRFRCKVNLNTIREVKQPRSADEVVKWRDGYAWLAGGTWLFSTIAELYGFKPPAEWTAAPLFQLCARAFLASFKIWNAATVAAISACRCRQARW